MGNLVIVIRKGIKVLGFKANPYCMLICITCTNLLFVDVRSFRLITTKPDLPFNYAEAINLMNINGMLRE